ncbi:MAG: Rrf2 family transcriptional regulator [Dysgonamonadaceae bacterium]|jgi:Rrf2 family protein|nr:Rrf2 family transcriptional regulator [Dysgonamonadaceae bacterium]MDD3357091.1 Rrf2 family transcriptional regulator [Dysgonamonadaceae bacterium]MDD3728234.1 Rrf2 family transcriptional regulator [Dysgonamonadaceae bacterium]MDD4247410.1 Rrf2 family transcriptional regulator [Dysgonamonadaceae bacterium]MDD4604976.1 Rrf2 family transcriptional regulator [Dysgonamonadaceae bacterium]
MFSKACEYGIKASVYIVEHSLNNQKVSLKEVASAIDSPQAYTSKILQQLSRNNIIRSEKGPTGGFSIDKTKINRINLSTIVSAIDGDSIYKGCGLGFHQCDESKPCVIHHQYKTIRNDLKTMLENTFLIDLSEDIDKGLSFLKS